MQRAHLSLITRGVLHAACAALLLPALVATAAPGVSSERNAQPQDEAQTDSSAAPGDRGKRGKDSGGSTEPLDPRERAAKLLKSRKSSEVRQGLSLYGGLRDKAAAKVLMRFIRRSKNDALRVHAIGALSWNGHTAAVAFLSGSQGMASRRPAVVAAACAGLARVGDKSASKVLFAAVTSQHAPVVVAATKALAALDPASASLPPLLSFLLDHASQDVRQQAVVSLRTSFDRECVKALVRQLTRESASVVRKEICATLGTVGGKAAATALQKAAADDADKSVRAAARAAAAKLTTVK